MTPIERLLAWLWDPSGRRREAQAARVTRTAEKRHRNLLSRRRAIDQVRRTNVFVATHRGDGR